MAKGTFTRRNKIEVWSAKVKTQSWLDELARRAGQSGELRRELDENLREQTDPAPTTATSSSGEPI